MENETKIILQNTCLQVETTLSAGIDQFTSENEGNSSRAITLKLSHAQKPLAATFLYTAERQMVYAFTNTEEVDKLISHLQELRQSL